MAQTLRRRRPRVDRSLPDPISNRPKSSGSARRQSNFPPEFYNSLSKIWLTPRALRELDRRNELLPLSKSKPAAELVKPRRAKLAAQAKLGVSEPARLAASGGPDLSDLKGYPEPTNAVHSMASPQSSLSRDTASVVSSSTEQARPARRKSATSNKSRRTSAYDENFMQHVYEFGIYSSGHELSNGDRSPKPENFKEILEALKQPRDSLPPSDVRDTVHEDFVQNLRGANEGDLARKIVPLIAGGTGIPNSGNCKFNNLISITEKSTVTLKPDYFEGARFGDVDKNVRKALNKKIIPTKNAATPIVPNFFLEIKSDAGKMRVAEAQATIDGANGAYIMHALQNYLKEPVSYDGKAYAFSAILVRASLELYAHHLTAPTGYGGRPDCHTTLLRAYALNDVETYWTGRSAFRNLSLRAKEDRDRLIAEANEKARRRHTRRQNPGRQNTRRQNTRRRNSVRQDSVRQNTVDEGTGDGSTERVDKSSRAGEEQQDQGSSPLDFYDAHAFIVPSQNPQDATQETQNTTYDSQLTNAAIDLGYETENTEVGVDGTTSFTSATYESYRQPRRLLRTHSSLASSSARQTPRNALPSSSTQKRTRSSASPPLTRQRRRRLESAG